MISTGAVVRADALRIPLRDATVDLIVTSPPYFALRSYRDGDAHYANQLGSEPSPQEFLEALWAATTEMIRVLKPTGSIWVNLGDKYAGSGGHNNSGISRHGTGSSTLQGNGRPDVERRAAMIEAIKAERRNAPDRYNQNSGGVPAKSLMGLPWRYAIGCIDQLGLILRAEVIWSKVNSLPESVTDRVRRSHEQWFHFTKQGRYFSAVDEVRERYEVPNHNAVGTRSRSERRIEAVESLEDARDATRGGYDGIRTENPLGKLPGSVWTIEDQEEVDWIGKIGLCRKCGRLRIAGNGSAGVTPKVTDTTGSPTTAIEQPTDSPTASGSDQSPMDSPSTISAVTEAASTQSIWSQSRLASMSNGDDTPTSRTATTDTSSRSPTPTFVLPDGVSADCVCGTVPAPTGPGSVWSVPSEPLIIPPVVQAHYHLPDHFAAFPQEWPRRIILGWSPSGVCTRCGEGRRPVVEKGFLDRCANKDPRRYNGDVDGVGGNWAASLDPCRSSEAAILGYACACTPYTDHPERRGKDWRTYRAEHEGGRPTTPERPSGPRNPGGIREYHLAGWTPPPTRPAVILDPFGGTGTVAMVARTLGRTGITIDLSNDYCRLARWRIHHSRHAAKTEQRTWADQQGVLFA